MKDELKAIVKKMKERQKMAMFPVTNDIIDDLESLIQEKWEPKKSISEFPQEIHDAYLAMEKRNRLIFLAKHEMGYGDGDWIITYKAKANKWITLITECFDNPELTFETEEQAETVLKMVGLNDD